MKIFRWIAPLWALVQTATAGEATLTKTYQPLIGHSTIGIMVAEVTCLHWYANGVGSAVDLIYRRNVPPTDNPEQANDDLNVASICGLKFSTNDLGVESPPFVVLDASGMVVPEGLSGSREKIVRASLECLRRCLPRKLEKTPVTLKCKEADKEWLGKIVEEFNAHDRGKEFYESLEG